MPTIPADAPRGNYKFYDQAVTLPHVYNPGQTLDANLAKYLNQAVATSVGNRFGAAVRRGLEAINEQRAKDFKAGTLDASLIDNSGKKPVPLPATVTDLGWDFQAKIEEIFADFEPGVSQRGGGTGAASGDPVTTEVRRLAGVAVRDLYKAKGIKYMDMLAAKDPANPDHSMYAKHVDQYVEAKGDQLRAIVEAQFAAMKSMEAVADAKLDLGEAA